MTMNSLRLPAIALVAVFLGACAGFWQPANPLVGDWNATISTPMGNMNANLLIRDDLTGEMTSPELGAAALNNITVDGQDVAFSTTVDAQGQMLTLDFTGTVEGDSLQGSFDTAFGALTVNGTRQ